MKRELTIRTNYSVVATVVVSDTLNILTGDRSLVIAKRVGC